MTDFFVAKVRNDYAVFSRKTGAADTVFDTQAEAKIHCDKLNYDLQVKAAAHDLLDALKLARSCLMAQGYAEKLPAMVKINSVISAADGSTRA